MLKMISNYSAMIRELNSFVILGFGVLYRVLISKFFKAPYRMFLINFAYLLYAIIT